MQLKQVAFQIHIFPSNLSLLVKPEPAYAHSFRQGGGFTRLLQPLQRPRQMIAALVGLTLRSHSSSRAQPYSGCSGWVCRPFSRRMLLWFSQKALCSWSSSDTRGRPMSKCNFRFSSHSFNLEKAGLKVEKANRDFSWKPFFIHIHPQTHPPFFPFKPTWIYEGCLTVCLRQGHSTQQPRGRRQEDSLGDNSAPGSQTHSAQSPSPWGGSLGLRSLCQLSGESKKNKKKEKA